MLKWSEDFFLAVFTDQDSMLIRSAIKNSVLDKGEAFRKYSERKKKYKEKLKEKMLDSTVIASLVNYHSMRA